MKQILFIGAGHKFPIGPFTFMATMQDREQIHAKGLFFLPIDYTAMAAATARLDPLTVTLWEEDEKEVMALHKAHFARQCEQHNIRYTLHENDQQWDKSLLMTESRFADLILISGELFFGDDTVDQPNAYLREALHCAECPVLVVPENFSSVERLFMAYDGSGESLYAIKQFCYLFPELDDLPAEVLYIRDEAAADIPELENLKQYTRLKFNCMNFAKLHFKASEYFATWISEKRHGLLVSGSFGRSALSYATKPSFSKELIRDHNLPLFIAHH